MMHKEYKGSKMAGKKPANMMMDDKEMGKMYHEMHQVPPLEKVKKSKKKKK